MHLQIHLIPLAGIFILHIRNISQCLLGSFYLFIILFTWQFQTFVTSQIFSSAIDVQEMAPASKGRCNKIANISDIVSSKLKTKNKEKADISVYCTWKSLCKHLLQFILSNLIMMLRVFVEYSNWLMWHYFIFFSFLTTNVSSRRLDNFFLKLTWKRFVCRHSTLEQTHITTFTLPLTTFSVCECLHRWWRSNIKIKKNVRHFAGNTIIALSILWSNVTVFYPKVRHQRVFIVGFVDIQRR